MNPEHDALEHQVRSRSHTSRRMMMDHCAAALFSIALCADDKFGVTPSPIRRPNRNSEFTKLFVRKKFPSSLPGHVRDKIRVPKRSYL